MDTKEFKKRKKAIEKEMLEKILSLAGEAGVELRTGEIAYSGIRNYEGQFVKEPKVFLRFDI